MARTKKENGSSSAFTAISGFSADTFGRDQRINFKRRTSNCELRNRPPFNDSNWFREDDDVRWQFGVPRRTTFFVTCDNENCEIGPLKTKRLIQKRY